MQDCPVLFPSRTLSPFLAEHASLPVGRSNPRILGRYTSRIKLVVPESREYSRTAEAPNTTPTRAWVVGSLQHRLNIDNQASVNKTEKVVRILPPPPSWIGARLGHAKPQCFDDSRDSKNDSIFGARREMQRRIPPCTELHGRYRRPKQLAQYAKNPGEIRVFERRGQEPNF
jgi:hypothetical protein